MRHAARNSNRCIFLFEPVRSGSISGVKVRVRQVRSCTDNEHAGNLELLRLRRQDEMDRQRATILGEHLSASLGELHKGAGFMKPEPAALDRIFEAGAILRRRAALAVQ